MVLDGLQISGMDLGSIFQSQKIPSLGKQEACFWLLEPTEGSWTGIWRPDPNSLK